MSVALIWEYRSGEWGKEFFDTKEEAKRIISRLSSTIPHVRIWIDDEMIQRGFVAPGEDGEAWPS